MSYRIEKLEQKRASEIRAGNIYHGESLTVRRKFPAGGMGMERVSIADVKVDDEVFLLNNNYTHMVMKTSPIKKIITATNNSIEFETQTSIYLLTVNG